MERWEIIERRILLGAAGVMLAAVVWLLLTATLGRLFTALVLTLCAYWALWQAQYEDRLGSDAPVTRGELFMFRLWVWGRRIALGGIAGLWLHAAIALMKTDSLAACIVAFVGLFTGWVAWFGGGRAMSLSDDPRVHGERKRRYKDIK